MIFSLVVFAIFRRHHHAGTGVAYFQVNGFRSCFDNEQTAQQLAMMLNHQGPPIPARKFEQDGSYQVIAGLFKDQQEAEMAAKRIKIDLEIDIKLLGVADVP